MVESTAKQFEFSAPNSNLDSNKIADETLILTNELSTIESN